MRSLAILVSFALTSPLAAADFVAPEGCTTYMTVQSRGCEVSVYYRCAADPAGHQWRVDYGLNGKTYQSLVDAEAQWVTSTSFGPDIIEELMEGAPDPASFSELLETGKDSWEFTLHDSTGAERTFKGYDRLIGETVEIDGIPLQRTEFEMVETDGTGAFLRKVRGNEYINAEYGRFFGGTARTETAEGDTYPSDRTPIKFIFPGEAGFGSTVPLFQCTDMVSELAPRPGGAG